MTAMIHVSKLSGVQRIAASPARCRIGSGIARQTQRIQALAQRAFRSGKAVASNIGVDINFLYVPLEIKTSRFSCTTSSAPSFLDL
jgi:hypothetical protein